MVDEAIVCGYCGTPLDTTENIKIKKCSLCGAEMADEATFCGNCGHPFETAADEFSQAAEPSLAFDNKKKKSKKLLATILIVTFIVALIIISVVTVINLNNKAQGKSTSEQAERTENEYSQSSASTDTSNHIKSAISYLPNTYQAMLKLKNYFSEHGENFDNWTLQDSNQSTYFAYKDQGKSGAISITEGKHLLFCVGENNKVNNVLYDLDTTLNKNKLYILINLESYDCYEVLEALFGDCPNNLKPSISKLKEKEKSISSRPGSAKLQQSGIDYQILIGNNGRTVLSVTSVSSASNSSSNQNNTTEAYNNDSNQDNTTETYNNGSYYDGGYADSYDSGYYDTGLPDAYDNYYDDTNMPDADDSFFDEGGYPEADDSYFDSPYDDSYYDEPYDYGNEGDYQSADDAFNP